MNLHRICVIAAVLLLQACASRPDETLVFTIEQALATSPNGASLDRQVPGAWERLCIFRPQTPVAVIDSALGFSWRGAADSGIATDEDHTLLVFATADEVDRFVMYPREKGDFTAAEGTYCMAREDAVFQLRQPIDGSIPWVGPVPRVRGE